MVKVYYDEAFIGFGSEWIDKATTKLFKLSVKYFTLLFEVQRVVLTLQYNQRAGPGNWVSELCLPSSSFCFWSTLYSDHLRLRRSQENARKLVLLRVFLRELAWMEWNCSGAIFGLFSVQVHNIVGVWVCRSSKQEESHVLGSGALIQCSVEALSSCCQKFQILQNLVTTHFFVWNVFCSNYHHKPRRPKLRQVLVCHTEKPYISVLGFSPTRNKLSFWPSDTSLVVPLRENFKNLKDSSRSCPILKNTLRKLEDYAVSLKDL